MKEYNFILTGILVFTLNVSYGQIASSATEISPTMNGESIPTIELLDLDSKSVDLQALISEKPTMLLFYRGSWCPYCNVQLAGIQEASDQLMSLGIQIVAISPDTPEKMQSSVDKNNLSYTVLSDSSTDFIQKMGLAFKDRKGRTLPVPAVYLVDTNNVVQFNYLNPNYRVRPNPELIIAAAKILLIE